MATKEDLLNPEIYKGSQDNFSYEPSYNPSELSYQVNPLHDKTIANKDYEGNYSFEELTQGFREHTESVTINPNDELKAIAELKSKRDSASTSDIVDAVLYQAGKDNLGANIAEMIAESIYTDFKPNDEFKKNLFDSRIFGTIQNNKLDPNSYVDLKKAGSQEEYDYLTTKWNRITNNNKLVEESLSEKAQVASSVIGMVGDLDMFGGVVISAYSKSSNMMKLAKLETAYEVSLAAARISVLDNYHAEDMVIDIGFGVAANMGLAKAFGRTVKNDKNPYKLKNFGNSLDENGIPIVVTKPIKSPIERLYENREAIKQRVKQAELDKQFKINVATKGTPEYIANRKKIQDDMDEVRRSMGLDEEDIAKLRKQDEEIALNGKPTVEIEFNKEFKDLQRKSQDIRDKIADVEKNFDKEVASAKEQEDIYNEIATMRAEEASYRTRQAEISAQRRVDESDLYDKMQQARLHEQKIIDDRTKQNAILAEQFKNPRYKQSNINRREFFRKQKEIEDNIHITKAQDLLDSAKNSITKVRRELDKLLKEGGTKLKIANRRKKIDDLQKQIDTHKKDLDTAKTDKINADLDLKAGGRINRIVDDMMNDTTTILDDVMKRLKAEGNDVSKELQDIVNELYKRYPDTFKEIKNLLGSKIGNKLMEANKIHIEDLPDKIKKKLSFKQKAMIVAIGSILIPTAGFSSGGDNEDNTALYTVLFLAAVVVGVNIKPILNRISNPKIASTISDGVTAVHDSYKKSHTNTSNEASIARSWSTWLADISYTSLTSAISPFIKEGGATENFAKMMFYSHQGGDGLAYLSQGWTNSSMARYANVERVTFNDWLDNLGHSSRFNGMLEDHTLMNQFRQEVNSNMRLRTSKNKSIIAATEALDKEYADLYARAKDYGVHGFDKIKYEKGKTPRLWNKSFLFELLETTDKDSKVRLHAALTEGALKANGGDVGKAKQTASALMANFSKDITKKQEEASSIFNMVEDLIKDDVDLTEFASRLEKPTDASGRTHSRLNIDIDSIPSIEMVINGKKQTINMSMMVENDSKKLFDIVATEINGLSALGKAGFGTVQSVRDMIKTLPPKHRSRLNAMVDMMLGRTPDGVEIGAVQEMISAMKDITIAEKLPFVLFSVPYEFLVTSFNGGITKALTNISNMNKAGRSSIESKNLQQLIDLTGSATGLIRADMRGFMGKATADIVGLDSASNSKFRTMSHKVAQASMIANMLTSFTDSMQSSSLLSNQKRFAQFVNGEGNINKIRAKSYNIDDDKIAMFKDDFKFTNGELDFVDMSKWSRAKKDDYAVIIKRMGMEQVLEHTSGETSYWGNTSSVGRLVHALTSYPIMMHNVHLQNGMRAWDRQFAIANMAAFGGSYLGMQLKYQLLGKEVEDEQVALYALMNTLPLSALSAITSWSDPAVLDIVRLVTNNIDPVELNRNYND